MALDTPVKVDSRTANSGLTFSGNDITVTPGAVYAVIGACRQGTPANLAISESFPGDAWAFSGYHSLFDGSPTDYAVGCFLAVAPPGSGASPGHFTLGAAGDAPQRWGLLAYRIPGATAVAVQAEPANNAATSFTVTLGNAPLDTSGILNIVYSRSDQNGNAGVDFTLLDLLPLSTDDSLLVAWDPAPADATCPWTGLGNARNIGLAVEIEAASAPAAQGPLMCMIGI